MVPLRSFPCGSRCQHWGPLGSSCEDPLAWLDRSLLECLATVAGGCMAQPGDTPPLDGVSAASAGWQWPCPLPGGQRPVPRVEITQDAGTDCAEPSAVGRGDWQVSIKRGAGGKACPIDPVLGAWPLSQCGVLGDLFLSTATCSRCTSLGCASRIWARVSPLGHDLSMKQNLRQNPQIKLLLRLFLSLPGLSLRQEQCQPHMGQLGSIHRQ